MHENQKSKKDEMAVRVMEKHFIKSPKGKQYQAQFNQLEAEMMNLRKKYNNFWETAEPAFMDYMEEMGGTV